MADRLEEHVINCPCCGSRFTALVDSTEAGDEYVQDCEICCRPLRFVLAAGPEPGLIELTVTREDDG